MIKRDVICPVMGAVLIGIFERPAYIFAGALKTDNLTEDKRYGADSWQCLDRVQRLKDGKQVNRQTPRKILKWFGAAKRGEKIVTEILEAFRIVGIQHGPTMHRSRY